MSETFTAINRFTDFTEPNRKERKNENKKTPYQSIFYIF